MPSSVQLFAPEVFPSAHSELRALHERCISDRTAKRSAFSNPHVEPSAGISVEVARLGLLGQAGNLWRVVAHSECVFTNPPDHGDTFIQPFLHLCIIQSPDGVYPFAFDENNFMARTVGQHVDIRFRSDTVLDDPVHLLGISQKGGTRDLGYRNSKRLPRSVEAAPSIRDKSLKILFRASGSCVSFAVSIRTAQRFFNANATSWPKKALGCRRNDALLLEKGESLSVVAFGDKNLEAFAHLPETAQCDAFVDEPCQMGGGNPAVQGKVANEESWFESCVDVLSHGE